MGLFSNDEKFEFQKIPSTPEQDSARNYLTGLMGTDINHPELQIAGLSGTEQEIQDRVRTYLADTGGDYDLVRGHYRNVLSGDYKPEEDRYYQGVAGQLDVNKADAQAGVRRTAQKAGSSRSTPFLGVEARTGQEYDFQKDRVLGEIAMREREGALQGLPQTATQEIGQISAADAIASKERQIEQMKFQAAYNKVIQDLLAPFQYNAQVASTILNEQRYMGVQSGGGMNDLGFALSVGAGAFASYSGAKAGAA